MKKRARNVAVLVLSLGLVVLAGCGKGNPGTSGDLNEIPGISGDWAVDSKKMMTSYMKSGLSKWDAAMEVASYSHMRITISGNTITMKDNDGSHNCTAKFKTLSFGSEEELLDAFADYHSRSRTYLREETQELISAGKLNLVIAEITSNKNNGKGMDIFKVGQKCIFYAPGPNEKDPNSMPFTFKAFGDKIVPLALKR